MVYPRTLSPVVRGDYSGAHPCRAGVEAPGNPYCLHANTPMRPDSKAKPKLPGVRSVLNERHDIAFAVLEPGRLRPTAGEDAIAGLHARHVVVLERHALRPQVSNFTLDVVDLPECLTRP